jgi:TonB-linked SusC/RagA family outer membrane protein
MRNFYHAIRHLWFLRFLLLFATLFSFGTAYGQSTISGRITSASDHSPLPGVSVLVKGTKIGATTNKDGDYVINAAGNAILVFSSVAYEPKEVPVNNQQKINIELQESSQGLSEVVVVGYGTQKRVNVTGSISTVSGKELQQTPVANLTNALAGRLSGVIGTTANGRPGEGAALQIRGTSTLNNNSPLVIIDGIAQRDFADINSNDIESITVLKDASSAAIYGARAANGVFLVTTKRGALGQPSISYSGSYGVQNPTQYPELMSAFDYATLKNQVLKNSGVPAGDASYYNDQQLNNFKQGIGTVDWYKETFKKNSPQTQHNVSINGGTDAVRYFASIGYVDQDGMYDKINFNRYNFRSNVDAKVNKTLNIGLNLEGSQRHSNTAGYDADDIFNEVIQVTNILPGAYWPDGRAVNTSGAHPVEMIRSSGYSAYQNNFFTGTLFFNQQLPFISGLSLKGTYSITKRYDYVKWFQTPYSSYDEDGQGNITNTKVNGGNTSLDEYYTQGQASTANLSLNYAKTFNKHNISALILAEQFSDDGNTFSAHKQDFTTNLKDELYASGPLNQSSTGNGIINDFRQSLVGRVNYAYAGKYLFEASFRYDGSYRFPKGERFGFFPAASVGWRISDEPFFKNSASLKFIDNLKLRASRGVIGNDRVDAFQFQDAYSINANSGPIIGGAAQPFVNYGVDPNPNITWERQINNNIGFESSFFGSKLGLEVDYFFRTTKDILWTRQRSVPATFGRSLPSDNYAQVKSSGIEVTLNHQYKAGQVEYNLRLIGSFARNEVTQIDDPANALDYQKQLGRPVGFVSGFQALGIFQSQQEADNWYGGYQFEQKSIAGDIKYEDLDKDGVITNNDQKVLSDNGNNPAITFGFQAGVKWKGFDVNFLIQGAAERTLLLDGYARQAFRSGGATGTFQYLSDSWSPDNTDAQYPIASLSPRSIDNRTSDVWLKNAAYARLKSVSLGYTFNNSFLTKRNIKNLRVYVSGYNLFTWSQVKEFDPEAKQGGVYYPQQKEVNLGVNFSF